MFACDAEGEGGEEEGKGRVEVEVEVPAWSADLTKLHSWTHTLGLETKVCYDRSLVEFN